MRETCPAIGAGADMECSIDEFVIARRRRAQLDGRACRSLGRPSRAVTPVREGILQVEPPLSLHLGGRLEGVRVAWRLTGNPDGPLVAALGGISAGRAVADVGTSEKGWWCEVDRPRQGARHGALPGAGHRLPRRQRGDDRTSHRTDQLPFDQRLRPSGDSATSCRASARRHRSPRSSARPTAAWSRWRLPSASRQLVDSMQWRSARRIDRIRWQPRGAASSAPWSATQRKMATAPEGLRLARALAMATYRSPEEFAVALQRRTPRGSTGASSSRSSRICWRAAMRMRRRTCPKRSCACPSPSTCITVDAPRIRVPVTLVAILEDQLVPISRSCARCRRASAVPRMLVELSSLYGHDAFLKEGAALRPVFARALAGQAGAP